MSRPLEDYALLSDCHSAALVGKNGSIDWLAFPRFDSAACFTALLGGPENGRWAISPTAGFRSRRRYLKESLVIETIFETSQGSCRLTDCMPYGEKHPSLIRIVEGMSGSVELRNEFSPLFDYGRTKPWFHTEEPHRIIAIGGPDALILNMDSPLRPIDGSRTSEFSVSEGQTKRFVLTWYPSHLEPPELPYSPEDLIQRTLGFWQGWNSKCTYSGFAEASVRRSLLVLKALTYKPTGAIIAAPTTSLPEQLGGSRNWDYRFSWIRDSSMALLALLRAGYREEAKDWKEWLLRVVGGDPSETNIMYGIQGERRLDEIELDWLPGYEDSRPVRIGNAAHNQFQLDVFGEMLSTSYLGRKDGIHLSERSWLVEKTMANYVCDHWQEPDEGIWEVRGEQQHFVHSKLMAWAALRYSVMSARNFGLTGDVKRWERLRDEIHAEICEKGFNKKLNSFVQHYGSKELDASLLMLARVDFLPPEDPRIVGTVEAIQENLMDGGLVRRYRTGSGIDGIGEKEGCFIPCTFWLVDNLRLLGRNDEALELYHHVDGLKNDVGLFSEEYSVKEGRMLGNFPQGFSHIAHAVSAMGFERSTETKID